MRLLRTFLSPVIAVSLLVSSAPVLAADSSSFRDVKPGDFGFEAVEYLKMKGVLAGYGDGTFRPDKQVNRAEAIKIIAAPFMTETEQKKIGKSVYDDVKDGDWYVPYVEWSRQQLRILDGPPKTTAFHPLRSVTKAEFLKMMLLANGVDSNAYSEIKLPLASDVADATQWFYPFYRYAVSTAVTAPAKNGTLGPSRELTRVDVAVLLYRYLRFKDGNSTQVLLDNAQAEIVNVLNALDKTDVKEAEYASARALIAARGALTSAPNEGVVKSSVKLAEGFRSLVRAYRAGIDGKFDDVIKLSGDAWYLGSLAKKMSPETPNSATQLQALAKSLADSARARKK